MLLLLLLLLPVLSVFLVLGRPWAADDELDECGSVGEGAQGLEGAP